MGDLTFVYRNHRGVVARRRIVPSRIWFGVTEWHPEPQWFMAGWCFDKRENRDFALRDMHFDHPPVRVCVNCGRPADATVVRPGDSLPECVDRDGASACTFDMTSEEAWQHWRREAHRLRACIADALRVLDRHNPSQPTRIRKQAVDDAMAFLRIGTEK